MALVKSRLSAAGLVFLAGLFAVSAATAQAVGTPGPDDAALSSTTAAVFSSAPNVASYAQDTLNAPPAGQKAIDRASFLQGLQAAMQLPVGEEGVAKEEEKPRNLGDINDPTSPAYKANKLAEQARHQRESAGAPEKKDIEEMMNEIPPPRDVESLQRVNDTYKGTPQNIADEPVSEAAAVDMRRDAQKEAALSYGARGGLAKRNYEIMERMKGFDRVLDKVFDFRSLLIRAPSGLLMEPPIVKESLDALVITGGGDEAAVADKVFDINKKAKIVSTARDWRQYLIQNWSDVPPPPRVLWPRTPKEQAEWNGWVGQGWQSGFEQGDQMFESNVNRLVADYNGMVRYRMLLAQGMISAPYAMHEDRGVTGDKNQMRVGDRAVRITGPAQFLTGAELWKPADR